MTYDANGVHANHCCNTHGCKYGYEDCPVELGVVEGLYPCENCEWFEEEVASLTRDEVKASYFRFRKEYQKVLLEEVAESLQGEGLKAVKDAKVYHDYGRVTISWAAGITSENKRISGGEREVDSALADATSDAFSSFFETFTFDEARELLLEKHPEWAIPEWGWKPFGNIRGFYFFLSSAKAALVKPDGTVTVERFHFPEGNTTSGQVVVMFGKIPFPFESLELSEDVKAVYDIGHAWMVFPKGDELSSKWGSFLIHKVSGEKCRTNRFSRQITNKKVFGESVDRF